MNQEEGNAEARFLHRQVRDGYLRIALLVFMLACFATSAIVAPSRPGVGLWWSLLGSACLVFYGLLRVHDVVSKRVPKPPERPIP